MVGRISTAGVNLHTLLAMQNNKQLSDLYTNQMTTGYEYQRLQDYGTDMKRILDYENIIEERNGYIRAINLVEPITDSYEEILAQLAEVAGQVMNASDPLSVKRESFPGETATLAENWMVEFEANLNVQIGGRYIFAGTNYTQAPVEDVRSMDIYSAFDHNNPARLQELGFARSDSYVTPLLNADGSFQTDANGDLVLSDPIALGQENALETANQLPQQKVTKPILDADGNLQYTADGHVILEEVYQSYSTFYTEKDSENERSWTEMSMTINDLQVYKYSISSNEGAFQMLQDAMLLLKSAAQTFPTGAIPADANGDPAFPNDAEEAEANWEMQREMLREAYNLAETARLEIRKLEVRNGASMTALAEAVDFHQRFVTLSEVSRDELRNADENAAAISLAALNHQIEASYTTIAKRAELSLTNYLR